MKKHILDRYSRSEDGKIIIEIAAEKVEDLYNDFDKTSPYLKKELEQGVADYITDSVHEIGKEDFVICFRFDKIAEDSLMERTQKSIQNYFVYLRELEFRELAQKTRTSIILLAIGIAILFLSVWVNQQTVNSETVLGSVFAEGLTVAAWVSLWESLATFLINWAPHRRQIKRFERIAAARVIFRDG